MANLNVNRNVADPFYRYKMPRIIAKVKKCCNLIVVYIFLLSVFDPACTAVKDKTKKLLS